MCLLFVETNVEIKSIYDAETLLTTMGDGSSNFVADHSQRREPLP